MKFHFSRTNLSQQVCKQRKMQGKEKECKKILALSNAKSQVPCQKIADWPGKQAISLLIYTTHNSNFLLGKMSFCKCKTYPQTTRILFKNARYQNTQTYKMIENKSCQPFSNLYANRCFTVVLSLTYNCSPGSLTKPCLLC